MVLTYHTVIQIYRIYDNICEYYGMSSHYNWGHAPKLILTYVDYPNSNVHGEFSSYDRSIILNSCGASWETIIKTLIHEYQHYLQHPGWYTRYENMFNYANNPYEIQAETVAERDWKHFKAVCRSGTMP